MSNSTVRWEPIDHLINDSLTELQVDNIAVTIGHGDTALATFAWPEDGQYAMCRAVPVDAPQPLEMPTEAGWWAFEGRWTDGVEPFQVALWVYRDGELLRCSAGCDATDLDELTGKWTRVYMPWEQRPGEVGG